MTRSRVLAWAVVCVCGAAAGYLITMAARSTAAPATRGPGSPTRALYTHLGLSAEAQQELRRDDPEFETDLQRLRAARDAARADLAALLEQSDASDEEIIAGLEQALQADNAMERRVMRFVLSVRHHLDAGQQRRLLDLAAEGVRRGHQYRWGRGGPDGGQGFGNGRGGGNGPGRGAGGGGGGGGHRHGQQD